MRREPTDIGAKPHQDHPVALIATHRTKGDTQTSFNDFNVNQKPRRHASHRPRANSKQTQQERI
jgi:hypothetical protein